MSNEFKANFKDVQNALDRLRENAERLEGSHQVSFSELFSPPFMQTHTSFASWEKFALASGLFTDGKLTPENFAAIPDDQWESWVTSNTRFKTWEEMQQVAAQEYVQKNLFKGLKR